MMNNSVLSTEPFISVNIEQQDIDGNDTLSNKTQGISQDNSASIKSVTSNNNCKLKNFKIYFKL